MFGEDIAWALVTHVGYSAAPLVENLLRVLLWMSLASWLSGGGVSRILLAAWAVTAAQFFAMWEVVLVLIIVLTFVFRSAFLITYGISTTVRFATQRGYNRFRRPIVNKFGEMERRLHEHESSRLSDYKNKAGKRMQPDESKRISTKSRSYEFESPVDDIFDSYDQHLQGQSTDYDGPSRSPRKGINPVDFNSGRDQSSESMQPRRRRIRRDATQQTSNDGRHLQSSQVQVNDEHSYAPKSVRTGISWMIQYLKDKDLIP